MAAAAAPHHVQTIAGVSMPRVLYGTAWKKERTADLVIKAVLTGFRGIDTACQPKHYQEDLVGAALVQLQEKHNIRREDLFLQTKFTSIDGQDPKRIPYDPSAPLTDQVQQSFARSLENLHTEYLDSLVLHSPMRRFDDTLTVWRVFESFVSDGKVRQLGISNIYDPSELRRLFESVSVKPAVVQNRFHAKTGYDMAIREFCRQNGIVYQSFWTLTANTNLLQSAAIATAARHRGATAAQVWYRFVLQRGMVPLIGTTNESHMKIDLEVLDWEGLSDDEMFGIGKLINEQF